MQLATVSALHYEIVDFVQLLQCTEKELEQRNEAIRRLAGIVRACHSNIRTNIHVTVFGSFASGLAWHASDVDIMIEGICTSNVDGSYSPQERKKAVKALFKLGAYLRASRYFNDVLVLSRPRVPIIKCRSRRGVWLDISYGTAVDRLEAAEYLVAASQSGPVVPLVLVLRVLLQQAGLDKVMTGGLSSWVVSLMVVGFLLERRRRMLDQLHNTPSTTPTAVALHTSEQDIGQLLVEFLHMYGQQFDHRACVVAPALGGVVSRAAVGGLGDEGARRGMVGPPAVVVMRRTAVLEEDSDDDYDDDDDGDYYGEDEYMSEEDDGAFDHDDDDDHDVDQDGDIVMFDTTNSTDDRMDDGGDAQVMFMGRRRAWQRGGGNRTLGARIFVQDPITNKVLGGESHRAAEAIRLFCRAEHRLKKYNIDSAGALGRIIHKHRALTRDSTSDTHGGHDAMGDDDADNANDQRDVFLLASSDTSGGQAKESNKKMSTRRKPKLKKGVPVDSGAVRGRQRRARQGSAKRAPLVGNDAVDRSIPPHVPNDPFILGNGALPIDSGIKTSSKKKKKKTARSVSPSSSPRSSPPSTSSSPMDGVAVPGMHVPSFDFLSTTKRAKPRVPRRRRSKPSTGRAGGLIVGRGGGGGLVHGRLLMLF